MIKHPILSKGTSIVLLFVNFLLLIIPMAIELGVKFRLSWLKTLSVFLTIPIFISTSPAILSQQYINKLYYLICSSAFINGVHRDRALYLIISFMFLGVAISSILVVYFLLTNPGYNDLDFFTTPLSWLYLWHQIAQLIPIVIAIIYFGVRGFSYFIEKIARDNERKLVERIGLALVCITVIIQVVL